MDGFIGWLIGIPGAIYNQFVAHPYDTWSFVIFISVMSFLCIKYKDKLEMQKIAGNVLYIILYRTQFGIKLMNTISERFRRLVKFFGYTSIIIGFLGMIWIVFTFGMMLFFLVFRPGVIDDGVTLVLPFTNMPGVGYLSFWHWILALFFLAVVHEFAHGVVSRAHNINIKSSGFAVFGIFAPIAPAAFVEPDEKQMDQQKLFTQLSVYSAGPAINIIIALIIFYLMPYVGSGLLFQGELPAPFEDRFTTEIGVTAFIIESDSPALIAGMNNDTLITSVNGKDIKNYNDLSAVMESVKPNETVTLETNVSVYNIKTSSFEDAPEKAKLGIIAMNEKRIREDVPKWEANSFFWTKELIKWIFIFNLLVGLMNLLPMGPVDGGRILKTVLEKTIKNKKIAQKIWGYIGLFFLSVLLFSLIVRYLGNPFALFN